MGWMVRAMSVLGIAGGAAAQGLPPAVSGADATAASAPPIVVGRPGFVRPGAAALYPGTGAPPTARAGGLDFSRLSVVEIPVEPGPRIGAPSRPHHALSLRSDTMRGAMRSLGLDASECATQFRAPTRWRPAGPNTEGGLDTQVQVRLTCRF